MNSRKTKPFYVGWKTKAPLIYTKYTLYTISVLIILIIAILCIYIFNQKGFSSAKNELGTLREFKGIIYSHPVPTLRIEKQDSEYYNALLFGFGKFSADKTINYIQRDINDNLTSYEVTLKGHLIHYDGRKCIEIPLNANKNIIYKKIEHVVPKRKREIVGNFILQGEIVDPKCYLGIMKPGYGKIHKSCAIRCLSGGIPPMFISSTMKDMSEYFILIGNTKDDFNKEILKYVAVPVEIEGYIEKIEDWHYLKIDPLNSIRIL